MPSQRERAGMPLYPELRFLTLEVMCELNGRATNVAINEAVAARLGLNDEQRSVMAANERQTEYAYRIAWARSVLKAVGAIDNPRLGVWEVTQAGRTMTREQIGAGRTTPPIPLHDEEGWQEDLLRRLRGLSPAAFEHLVADLLRADGYDDVRVIGRPGDGGIDGICVYRPSSFISFRTAFQCKRYGENGKVTRGDVGNFRGSFTGRTDRGILVTSGNFTRDARAEASREGAIPVDLVDGDQLCEILKDYGLGVKVMTRTVEDIDIDDDYFERLLS